MWCIDCRQDVPGLSAKDAGRYECPRCGGVVCDQMEAALPPVLASIKALDRTEEPASPPAAPQHYDLAEPPLLDTWELDEQLRHAARLLGLHTGDGAAPARLRSDPAQPAAPR